jgi:hypothetical protein
LRRRKLRHGIQIDTQADGTWTETILHDFNLLNGGVDGSSPDGSLVFDALGNLYSTTVLGGSRTCTDGCGTVFKITP